MTHVDRIVDLGVDWITCTATTKTASRNLLEYGYKALLEERDAGNERRCFNFKGYEGFKCGSIQTGARRDGSIFIATGGLARQHYLGALHLATNVSRIDFQVTVKPECSPQHRIAASLRGALKHRNRLKKKTRVRFWKDADSPATLYLGHETSERRGIIYDKGVESKLPVFKGCVRNEVRYIGAMAFHQAKLLARAKAPADYLVAELSRFFKARNCPLLIKPTDTQTTVLHRPATDHQRQLEWIRTCISPTVQRLIKAGYADELFDALHVWEILLAQKKNLDHADLVAQKKVS